MIEALCPAQGDVPQNAAEPLFGPETYVGWYSKPGLTNRRAASSITLADAALFRMAPLPSVIYMRLRGQSLMTQTRVNGQHLAPPREPIRLSTNTRIVTSSSGLEGKPAVMP